MTCKRLQELLLEHHARELPLHLTVALRTHAAFCRCCRAMIGTYGVTVSLSHELADAEVPPEVASDLAGLLRDLAEGRVPPG